MSGTVGAVRLSPLQRQLCWMLLPVAAGLISSFHVVAAGPHPSQLFSWTMVAIAISPGFVKMTRHQLRTGDGFWVSQGISLVGTVVTTAASYIGIWLGAVVAIGVLKLYANPSAPSGTIAVGTVVTVLGPLGCAAWRKAGHRA